MEGFESGGRDTEDDSAQNRLFKIPKTRIPEGLKQAREAALEKLQGKINQGNPTCPSGPSNSQAIFPKAPLAAKPRPHENTEYDLNQVKKLQGKINQGNPTCLSGSSTSQTILPKAPLAAKPRPHEKTEYDLNQVGKKFGIYLQPECTKFPVQTCDPAKEDPKPLHSKPAWNKLPSSASPGKEGNTLGAKPKSNLASQKSEARPAFPKVAEIKEKIMAAAQESEPKPSLFKKPSANIEVSNNKDTSNKCDSLQSRLLGPRTNTHSLKKVKEMGENNSAAEAAGSHLPKIAVRPAGHSQTLFQGSLRNVEKETEGKAMSGIKITMAKKVMQEGSDSAHKFQETNTALGGVRSSDETQEKEDGSPTPRQKILDPVKTPPEKPSKPPCVELRRYRRRAPKKTSANEGSKRIGPSAIAPPSDQTAEFPSPTPISHPDQEVMAAPSLPPRNIKPSSEIRNQENEENYDDVEFVSQGHGSTQGGQEGDKVDKRSREEETEQKRECRRIVREKTEKMQKEKKHLELQKKFKLVGPIEVLHQARARVDYKGRTNELTVKQGDKIEIIRLTNNPPGKFLARIGECYGYIKNTMVEIDYDSLKRKQQSSTGADMRSQEGDMEVYDDVGQQESLMSLNPVNSGAGNVFPVPPPPSNQDIYDEIGDGEPIARSVSQDEDKNGIWSWGILKRLKVKDDKKKSIREKTTKDNGAEDNGNSFTSSSTNLSGKDCGEDIYDDVDSSDFPPPPLDDISLKAEKFGKKISDEKDVKKQKKMEKEEKEFRKKFKFVGEIKVLYSTTAIQNLPKRRWRSRELPIKPGESLDIIESTDDVKVLGRNEEGKYGYIWRSNLVQDDGEIYDNVGEDCVYDNNSNA